MAESTWLSTIDTHNSKVAFKLDTGEGGEDFLPGKVTGETS